MSLVRQTLNPGTGIAAHWAKGHVLSKKNDGGTTSTLQYKTKKSTIVILSVSLSVAKGIFYTHLSVHRSRETDVGLCVKGESQKCDQKTWALSN